MNSKVTADNKVFPRVLRHIDPAGDFQAFVVIDSLLGGRSAGGIRMTCDVSEAEVAQLASNMTLKYGFANVYYGGAKSGICITQLPSSERRQEILETFGKKFAEVIQPQMYQPGEDIGTGPEDVSTVLRAAGCPKNPKGESHARSSLYTAWSIIASTERLFQDRGVRLEGSSWILEGFGKVGAEIAQRFQQKGMKLLAASTRAGAIYNPNGINVQELLDLQPQWGDECLNHSTGNETINLAHMLTLKSDLLILAGKPEAIDRGNVKDVNASLIVSGGNIAITPEAEKELIDQGHVVLPDFVTNSGGVLGLTWNGAGVSEEGIRRLFSEEFGEKISQLLSLARTRSETVRRAAEYIAQENIKRMKQEVEHGEDRPGLIKKMFSKGFHWVTTQLLRVMISAGVTSNALRYAHAKAIFWADKHLYTPK